jgi:hypothetical protein
LPSEGRVRGLHVIRTQPTQRVLGMSRSYGNLQYREEYGEIIIIDDGWVMRDLWDTRVKISNGLVTFPKKLGFLLYLIINVGSLKYYLMEKTTTYVINAVKSLKNMMNL